MKHFCAQDLQKSLQSNSEKDVEKTHGYDSHQTVPVQASWMVLVSASLDALALLWEDCVEAQEDQCWYEVADKPQNQGSVYFYFQFTIAGWQEQSVSALMPD